MLRLMALAVPLGLFDLSVTTELAFRIVGFPLVDWSVSVRPLTQQWQQRTRGVVGRLRLSDG